MFRENRTRHTQRSLNFLNVNTHEHVLFRFLSRNFTYLSRLINFFVVPLYLETHPFVPVNLAWRQTILSCLRFTHLSAFLKHNSLFNALNSGNAQINRWHKSSRKRRGCKYFVNICHESHVSPLTTNYTKRKSEKNVFKIKDNRSRTK